MPSTLTDATKQAHLVHFERGLFLLQLEHFAI